MQLFPAVTHFSLASCAICETVIAYEDYCNYSTDFSKGDSTLKAYLLRALQEFRRRHGTTGESSMCVVNFA